MSVTLDVERTWRVGCDYPECPQRLYLHADTPGHAAARARDEHGWLARFDGFDGIRSVECRVHGSTR